MSQVCLISDLHGCYGTMVRLLNQVAAQHPGARLMFGGDLIDRGPNSRAMVEFSMTHKVPTCQGNHESLALAYSAHTRRGYKTPCAYYYDRDVWLMNGGEEALASWEPDETKWRNGLPKDVLDWMQALPAYIEPDAPLDENGKRLWVSHTGYGDFADAGDWVTALWGRLGIDGPAFADDGRWRCFGHTPVKTPQLTLTYGAIDTGAAYADRGGGIMTALIWPTKTLVQQAFDESPVEPTFAMVDGCVVPR